MDYGGPSRDPAGPPCGIIAVYTLEEPETVAPLDTIIPANDNKPSGIIGGVVNPLLSMRGIVKTFPGTVALDSVDFDVVSGEIHALVGENGAGKSTLIKILAGVYPADSGTILLLGERYVPGAGHRIAFMHQDLGLFPPYSVAENIAIIAGYPRSKGLISWRRARDRARELLSSMGSTVDPDELVAAMTIAERSIVAIARALAVEAAILILDEPTSSLPETDVRRLFDILTRLRDRGMGIVFVSHRLDEVFRIADRVTVLRDGRRIITERVADTTPSGLVYHIVGRELSRLFVSSADPSSDVVLELEDLKVGRVGPVSLRVRRGEILGLVGLRGAGQDVVGRAVFGETGDWKRSGAVRIGGNEISINTPADAMRSGVGFVSSKRAEECVAGSLTTRENVYPNPATGGRSVLTPVRPNVERRRIRAALDRFDIRPRDPERAVGTLSGGNQQKAILARWLEIGSHLLVLEEPTFGVDIGAKAEIYSILREHAERGNAILLVSSDFEEVAGMSHRALVFRGGKVVGEVAKQELTLGRLTELASGAATGDGAGE
jgi:ribose transport system ATP-binding protein